MNHPYAYLEDGKLYRKAFLHFPALLLDEVSDPEPDLSFYERSFRLLEQKVNELEEAINNSDNKGSFLAKLKHIKSTLAEHRGLGDYAPIYEHLSTRELELEALIAANREKNLEIKRALVADAEALMDSVDWRNTAEKMKTMRQNWIKTGAVAEEYTEALEEAFKAALDHFFARRNAFLDEKNALIRAAEEKYREIIAEAAQLKNMSLSEAKAKVGPLINAWKELPKIPAPIQKNLWREFTTHTMPYKKKSGGQTPTRSGFSPVRKANVKVDIPRVVREKERLLGKLEDLERNWPENAESLFKELMEQFKAAGSSMGDRGKKLHMSFNKLAARMREEIFLLRLMHGKHTGFAEMSGEAQNQLQIQAVKELIARDEQEMQEFLDNLEKFTIQSSDADDLIKRKKQNLENRIEAKKDLLAKLKLNS